MRSIRLHIIIVSVFAITLFSGCRKDELVIPSESEIIPDAAQPGSSIRGFYLLNEGNMGSNKCTLDYFDYVTGLYARNIYAERNPNVIKELGDVGNDIGIYGSKLYVVVNCSHKVEVLDAYTGIRIGQIEIPNCRYVRFYKGKAYVSSYVGPVQINPDAPKGAVFEVDTASFAITRKVTVGYQPEQMDFADDYMYVANSGGYRSPDYDNTVSVVRISDFKQVHQIPVGINLHLLKKDKNGRLWVTSRGNNDDIPSRLFVMGKNGSGDVMEVLDTIDVPCSDFAFFGDYLYYFATEWDENTGKNTISYGIIDINEHKKISDNFITDGTEKYISKPYGLSIHPETGDIFITDAKNYVSSGTLFCFSNSGKKKWSVRTGDIPAHITFLYKK